MFFFSNFRPLPDMKGMNKGEKKKIETELNANGLYYPKRVEINAFIEYYLKLRDLYKKNDLPRAFFEQAIEDRLNQMRYWAVVFQDDLVSYKDLSRTDNDWYFI